MTPETLPNPASEIVSSERLCDIAARWGITAQLAWKLIRAAADVPFDIWIFSGARSVAHQERVSSTPFDRSTHADTDARGCPRLATGADVQPVSPGVRLSGAAVAQLGAAMVRQGLRWGGGAGVGDDGIPVGNERWHFDLGPRS
ncbi:MAG: hypothetical protein ACF8PN_07980 [Phycisphaerales bacterium]